MKRFLAILLVTTLLSAMIAGCTGNDASSTSSPTKETNTQPQEGKEMLNGKKIIFIGNSFTYYGKCVIEKAQSEYGLESRKNDMGYFYRICKENNIDVSVTNFTFGGHTLEDFYSGSCAADRGHNGLNHLDYLADRNYDYVVLQNGSRSASLNDVLNECKPLMEIFREANPNVKFVFLIQHHAYVNNYQWLPSVKNLEEAGFIVVDWGSLVYDVMTGTTQVPGATQAYDQNSFIISKSESDGFHPNMLTGYITALMTYCAITGESAQGQPHNFGDSDVLFGTAAVAAFRSTYYKYNPTTNFDNILRSESDMAGIQKLIDQHLAEKAYRNY